MPARDFYHDTVKKALEKDGWTITHDPYTIRLGRRKGYIDLGAEKLLGAEKGGVKIAVEVKSFLGLSDLDEFEDAVGQFVVYLFALEENDPERDLFLAIPETYYSSFFDDEFFVRLTERFQISILIFEEEKEMILQWIK